MTGIINRFSKKLTSDDILIKQWTIVTNTNFSSAQHGTKDIGVSGYVPLTCLEYQFANSSSGGTQCSRCKINHLSLNGNTLTWYAGTYTSWTTKVDFYVRIGYVKEH